MPIHTLKVAGYRSIRSLFFPLDPLTVFVGRNGVGKTNLYRALQLVQSAASGTLAKNIAAEGGMESATWAGERKQSERPGIRLDVSLAIDGAEEAGEYAYGVELGFAKPVVSAAFILEPQVNREQFTHTRGRRPTTVLERAGPAVFLLDDSGRRRTIPGEVLASETAFSRVGDAGSAPEVDAVRRTILDWRFYHDLRTDAASPLRRPSLAVTTPTLSSDGSDLAAVFATLKHIRGDTADLDEAIDDAFPGARLIVPPPERTAAFGLVVPEYPKRVFEPAELSDGTLRYLALAGALLGYRLPGFIALNEPEGSLHPDLLPALGRLIARASRRTQIWIVTHSELLAASIAEHGGNAPRTVIKRDGGTWIDGLTLGGLYRED